MSTRAALDRAGVRPSRRRGQCFLADPGVARRIVAAAGIAGRAVLEIGPGLGALTRELVREARLVVAVEVDPALAAALPREAGDPPNLRVIEGDALAVAWDEVLPAGEPVAVVANLPYSVGTAILFRLVAERRRFDRLVLMLQREVADRLAAAPGSKAYGAPTVVVGLHGTVRRLFDVPPAAFVPRPKVRSSVIAVALEDEPRWAVASETTFREIVRASFAHRRKTLRRALAGRVDEAALAAAGIDPARRGETLSGREFARLANVVTARRDA